MIHRTFHPFPPRAKARRGRTSRIGAQDLLDGLNLSWAWTNDDGGSFGASTTCCDASNGETYHAPIFHGELCIPSSQLVDAENREDRVLELLRWQDFVRSLHLEVLTTAHAIMEHERDRRARAPAQETNDQAA